jgi:hypothetical protein
VVCVSGDPKGTLAYNSFLQVVRDKGSKVEVVSSIAFSVPAFSPIYKTPYGPSTDCRASIPPSLATIPWTQTPLIQVF